MGFDLSGNLPLCIVWHSVYVCILTNLFFLLLDLACFLKGWPVVVEPVTRTIGQISQVNYQQSEYSSASKDLGQLSRDTTLWALCQIGT